MKGAVVQAAGQNPVWADFDEPQAGSGECVVTVAAAALSHLTRGRASGAHYSADGGFPLVAGVDGVGRLADGRRVYFAFPRAPFGGMAERTVVPSAQCVPVPDDLDDTTAAALANPGMSSWAALTARARLAPGETVLIHGATGTSGRLAVQIARHLGAGRVIATGRSADGLATAARLGADATIALGGPDLDAALAAQFADRVDVVLDYLWGESAGRVMAAAAKASPAGVPVRYVQIGSAAGGSMTLPSALLRSSGLTLMGSGLGSVAFPELLGAIAALLQAAGRNGWQVPVRTLPMAAVAEGWAAADDGRRLVFIREGAPG